MITLITDMTTYGICFLFRKPDLILSSALDFSLGRAFHGLVQRPYEVIFVSDSNQATGPFWYRPQGRLGYPFPY